MGPILGWRVCLCDSFNSSVELNKGSHAWDGEFVFVTVFPWGENRTYETVENKSIDNSYVELNHGGFLDK